MFAIILSKAQSPTLLLLLFLSCDIAIMAANTIDRDLLDLVQLKDQCNDQVKSQIDMVSKAVRVLQNTNDSLRRERDDARKLLNAGQLQGAQQQALPPSTPIAPSTFQPSVQQQTHPFNPSFKPAAPRQQVPRLNGSNASVISPRTSIQPTVPPVRPPERQDDEPSAKRQKPNFAPPTRASSSQITPKPPSRPAAPPPPPPRRYVACTMCWTAWRRSGRRDRHHCSGDIICDFCRSRVGSPPRPLHALNTPKL